MTTTTSDTSSTSSTATTAPAASFDEQVFGWYTGSFVTFMVDLGLRTGLFEAAARGPATSLQLAERAGLEERYVREWLGAVTTAGIFTFDPVSSAYTLPPDHARFLTGSDENNLAPLSQISSHLAPFVGPVAIAFKNGGGVPYSEYRPDFTDVMDGLSRPTFDGLLIDGIVPLVSGLSDRLTIGANVADIGCGTGHTTNLLAAAFPESTFVGYDLAEDAIERATAEADALALANVRFQVLDVIDLPLDPQFDVVFAFDAIHDQADPAAVLKRTFDSLRAGGVFVMFDIRASSHLEKNLDNPMAPWIYAVSTLHCMTVSLASGGAGLGTAWGEELALDMLAEAGFVGLEVHEVDGDPLDSVYVARKRD